MVGEEVEDGGALTGSEEAGHDGGGHGDAVGGCHAPLIAGAVVSTGMTRHSWLLVLLVGCSVLGGSNKDDSGSDDPPPVTCKCLGGGTIEYMGCIDPECDDWKDCLEENGFDRNIEVESGTWLECGDEGCEMTLVCD
jgi:hypothetical protein